MAVAIPKPMKSSIRSVIMRRVRNILYTVEIISWIIAGIVRPYRRSPYETTDQSRISASSRFSVSIGM